jgi:hypothetical protein
MRDPSFKTIELKDGRMLKNVADARNFLISLPISRQASPTWRYTADLLRRALERNEKYATMDLRAQLARALFSEGLL